MKEAEFIDQSIYISAGKFRRYHGAGWKQLLDIPTILLNFIDFFKFISGTINAYFILRRIKPNIIFIKGGYIGVPMGLAAAARGIKYITHDSDTVPGLANRIIARWATYHTVGMPKEYYDYPAEKTDYVGVPISDEYRYVDEGQQMKFKHEIGLDYKNDLVLVTGGGLGAVNLNKIVLEIIKPLLEHDSNLVVINIAGKNNQEELTKKAEEILQPNLRNRFIIKGFIGDLHKYSGAADLVISRAGATNLAEFAAQAKACIIVPSPYLVGGHQIKNAKALEDSGSVVVVDETLAQKKPELLKNSILELLGSDKQRKALRDNLHKFAHKESAQELAKIILSKA